MSQILLITAAIIKMIADQEYRKHAHPRKRPASAKSVINSPVNTQRLHVHLLAVAGGSYRSGPEAAVHQAAALDLQALLGRVLVSHGLRAPQALAAGRRARVEGAAEVITETKLT
jgi:hypothetical protein